MNMVDRQQCVDPTDAFRTIGDGWTLLIIWASLRGVTRFDSFQRRLGVARNILSNRLSRLVELGVLERRPVQTGGRRMEYRITPKGEELRPAIARFADWAARHIDTAKPGSAAIADSSGRAAQL